MEFKNVIRSARALLCCLICAGCVTTGGRVDTAGAPVRFDPVPPQSVQTQSLREVRFRRFAAGESFVGSEWSTEPSIWPVAASESEVISRFGPRGRTRRMHHGIDIKALTGTPVVATADGEVTFSGRRSGYGNHVEMAHGDGVATAYAHLDEIFVNVGDVVPQGTPIGTVGSTGNASTPHVHYEVLIDGQPYDPWLFLPAVMP